MSDLVWGTGYGSKRHIPGEEVIKQGPYGRGARAACSPDMIYLDTFSDDPATEATVMRKTPCVRCAKKAGVKACTSCNGSGVVPA